MIDTAIREFELNIPNKFESVSIPDNFASQPNERLPYSPVELKAIQQQCRQTNDQRRWAIAMLSDTGADAKNFNPSTASAALNKWMKENQLAMTGQGLHSFRHTIVDRLRNASVPKDVREQNGGWKSQGVSESYGQGFSLRVLYDAMLRIVT